MGCTKGQRKIKAIFFDIDGTLVSFKTHKVPQETKDAIRRLREQGIKVFVATGRMLKMVEVLNDIEFDGYITYNGSLCVDSTRENVIFKNTVPQDELEALVERLRRDRFPVSFMCRDEMYVNYLDELVTRVAKVVEVEPPIERPVEEIIKEDVFQLCIYVDEPHLQRIIDETLPGCVGMRWIELFADVNVRGMNKQLGIDKMLEHFGIPLECAMAFGDGGNDIPMLQHVPYGVAMGNANDAVKAAAAYVTDDVDDNGLVKALEHYGLL
ncbi:MAG: Cof-type HAD-IIB family hydrolase [Bacteroidales bacterium]|nr:Cof-type HAD-IIB family hydrolase [Bacteroidales bacterium]